MTVDRRRPVAWLLLTLALAFTALTSAEPAPEAGLGPGANLEVSLYTFGPGEEVWERFGHNAIEVRDRNSGTALLYNYGIFDFAQENFFLNFARGLMTYRIAAGDTADELPVYAAEGRWVVRQQLALSPAQRDKLATFLAWNAREENAQYRYDYFRANCSTRVRDALDDALGGAIKAQTIAPSRGFTYRMDADRLMRPDPSIMLLIDAGLGPFADRRLSYWDESFVPTELMRHLRDIVLTDSATGATRPLVATETRIAEARVADPPEFAARWTWYAIATGIAVSALLLWLATRRRSKALRVLFALLAFLLTLACGIAGVVLAALWGLTDHVSAWRNENLLLFNPLCLLLLPAWCSAARSRWQPSAFARRVAGFIAICAAFAWFAKILPGFTQDNAFWIALLLPIQLVLAFILRNGRRG